MTRRIIQDRWHLPSTPQSVFFSPCQTTWYLFSHQFSHLLPSSPCEKYQSFMHSYWSFVTFLTWQIIVYNFEIILKIWQFMWIMPTANVGARTHWQEFVPFLWRRTYTWFHMHSLNSGYQAEIGFHCGKLTNLFYNLTVKHADFVRYPVLC